MVIIEKNVKFPTKSKETENDFKLSLVLKVKVRLLKSSTPSNQRTSLKGFANTFSKSLLRIIRFSSLAFLFRMINSTEIK